MNCIWDKTDGPIDQRTDQQTREITKDPLWRTRDPKCPWNDGFPHLWARKIFFKNRALVTFVSLWCTNLMQKIRKK